jgi:TrmH family RNA methyltransferase
VGTVIRTSAGLGFSQVLLTKESANPWQPKVIRSGMGSHFKISVMDDIEFNADYVKSLIERKTLFIVTHCANKLGSNSTNITELSALSQTMTGLGATTFDNLILIVGNESRGVERTTMDMLEQLKASVITLTIPLENALDSLSCPVAFGIIGHELKKVFLV